MKPFARKLNLTAHVTASVGWIGGVGSFLALAIVAQSGTSEELARASYLAMNVIGGWVLVPLSVLSLLTGVVQAVGTPWGLLRYYWVVMKLGITLVASIILAVHQFTAVRFAAMQVSAAPAGELPRIGEVGTQLVADAALGLVALLTITVLSVFKPWGLTRYGHRKQRESRSETAS